MNLYLSGPMRGLPDNNYPEFRRVARELMECGYTVIDPSRRTQEDHPDWGWTDYMRAAIPDVLAAEGLAMLDNWENSTGARLEHRIADTLHLPIHQWETWVRPDMMRIYL